MRIGIELNDVLRNFTSRFEEIYNKYQIGETLDLKANPMTDFDLINTFKFKGGVDELNYFMYVEASLELFGLGKPTNEHVITKLNALKLDLDDEEEHTLVITGKEVNASVPASYFFLSKYACKVDEVKFYKKNEQIWDNIDVLITANPLSLASKPEGKLSIKINTTYNETSDADFSMDSIMNFIEDEKLREGILNSKFLKID